MTHVTCRLTAKNRDQLRNPTLGNRVWTTLELACHTLWAASPVVAKHEIGCIRIEDMQLSDSVVVER